MAKTIATVSGVAIRPGVSANRRLYTAPVIAAMVSGAQSAIESGADLSMLTHHGAEDASDRIVGRLRSMSLGEDGSARFTADLADTPHGRTMASLLDTSDGKPAFLKGVSIRGFWKGTVRKVTGPDGEPVETGDALELAGLDMTKTPGVTGAQVDSFSWTRGGARSETTERVLITESVQEARVTTITEDAGPVAAPVISEAVLEVFGGAHVLDNGVCVTCEASTPMSQRGSGTKGDDGKAYADPGYQADKTQRYDLSTKANAKAAWSYINQADNAKKYTAAQLKRIKGRIKAALSKFGVSVAAESAGWTVGAPASVSETLAECWPGGYGGSAPGSYCLTASNGPTSLTISSCSLDPEDLDPVLRAAADAACKALAALDPDMDGDLDVAGATGDAKPDESDDSAEPDALAETTTDPAAEPAAEPHTETEVPAMADTATPAVEASPAAPATEAASPASFTFEQVQALLAAAGRPAVETVPAAPAAPVAAETAAPAAPVAEAAEVSESQLAALVEAAVARRATEEGLTATETVEQKISRLVEAKLVPLRQAAAERTGTGTGRKGLLEAIAEQAPGTGKTLQEASGGDLAALAAAAYPMPGRR